jgi:mRNA-degrading endonuclease RelE of RelBE toxin-antitoxin system
VYTIIETPVYARKAAALLDDEERESVAAFVAVNPMAGSVIPGSGGIRKLRWKTRKGGKRGGYRVIYFNRLEQSQIWLLTISPSDSVRIYLRGNCY